MNLPIVKRSTSMITPSSSTILKSLLSNSTKSSSSLDTILIAIDDLGIEFKSRLEILISRFVELSDKITNLPKNIGSPDIRNLVFEQLLLYPHSIMKEFKSFQNLAKCKSYIIVYAISEPTSSDLASKITEEKKTLCSLLLKFTIDPAVDFKVIWLIKTLLPLHAN